MQSRGARLGLERTQAAVKLRNSPERDLDFVHIAGTNGKGSVATMMESVLRQAGYRTGKFSSPHLHRYVERVQINGRPLSEAETARRLEALRADDGLSSLTFFEYTTLLAFEAFRDAACDIVLLEVGLGGRLDSTNVVTPLVSVITNIGLEHQRILGDTIARIAKEKAGIIKPRVPVIVGARAASARRVISARARKLRAPLSLIGRDFDASWSGDRLDASVGKHRLDRLRLGLSGTYQGDNAACALAALSKLKSQGFEFDEADVRAGLARTRWPGRLEWHRGKPAFLFDAAHNADGCVQLSRYLEAVGWDGPVILLFGAMRDKDHRRMLTAFDRHVTSRVYASPRIHRAAAATTFSKIRRGRVARSVAQALQLAQDRAGPDGLVVVAGSIFLLAEVRALVKGIRSDPPIAM